MSLFLGILGLILLLLAFLLDAFDVALDNAKPLYILNMVGSALLAWYSVEIKSVPFFILESAWAIGSLAKLIQKRKK